MFEAAKPKIVENVERDAAQRAQFAARYRKLSNQLDNPASKSVARKAALSRDLDHARADVSAATEDSNLSPYRLTSASTNGAVVRALDSAN